MKNKIIAKILFHISSKLFLCLGFIHNKIVFFIEGVTYSEFPKISGCVNVLNRGSIFFGENVTITSCRKFNPVGNSSKTYIYCSPNAEIKVGNNVQMSNVTIFSQLEITIEDNVMLGGGVQIYDTDFHPLELNSRMKHNIDEINTKEVKLQNGCFVGANSIILKGVTIGTNSIIAAGSVVTKNIPNNQIWGGNPIAFIKEI